MSIYKDNAKPFKKDNKLKCVCGNGTKFKIKVYKGDGNDEEDRTWIEVSCKKCGHILFYNGA